MINKTRNHKEYGWPRLNQWGRHFMLCFTAIALGIAVFFCLMASKQNMLLKISDILPYALIGGAVIALLGTWHILFFQSAWIGIITASAIPAIVYALLRKFGNPDADISIGSVFIIVGIVASFPILGCTLSYGKSSTKSTIAYHSYVTTAIISLGLFLLKGSLIF